jgi:hypothetical protein
MTRKEIIAHLTQKHQQFADAISSLNDKDFTFSLKNEKWTAGQQIDHIYKSVSVLANGLRFLPKWCIKLIFGKANRPSKSYEDLVKKYHLKLEAGGRASSRFVPKTVEANEKEAIINKTLNSVFRLCKCIGNYSEEELDQFILPHPLLGKVTLREMMYFTIYHAEHHHSITKKNLQSRLN